MKHAAPSNIHFMKNQFGFYRKFHSIDMPHHLIYSTLYMSIDSVSLTMRYIIIVYVGSASAYFTITTSSMIIMIIISLFVYFQVQIISRFHIDWIAMSAWNTRIEHRNSQWINVNQMTMDDNIMLIRLRPRPAIGEKKVSLFTIRVLAIEGSERANIRS